MGSQLFRPSTWRLAGVRETRAGGWPSWMAAEGPCAPRGLWPWRAEEDVKFADRSVFLSWLVEGEGGLHCRKARGEDKQCI